MRPVLLPTLAALLLLPPAAARAQSQGLQYGDVQVIAAPQPKDDCAHGYTEYVFTVTNHSADRAHDVTLTIPHYNYRPSQDHFQAITRTVRAGPGATLRVALLQPHRPALLGSGLGVSIDGHRQERDITFVPRPSRVGPYVSRPGGFSGFATLLPQPLVLLSHRVPADFNVVGGPALSAGAPAPAPVGGVGVPAVPGGFTKGGPPRPPATGPAVKTPGPPASMGPAIRGAGVASGTMPSAAPRFARPEADVAAWSASWLAYSCYDGVVLTANELGRAPAGVQAALWQFAETGGTLLVLGEAKVPEGWRLRGGRSTACNVYDAGFGQGVVALDDYHGWPRARWAELRDGWARAGAPFQRVRTVVEANNDFPVVDDIGVPVRGLFVLMLVFAVAIGPVNMIVLARKNRRLWLLWTVPAISLATCLAVFGYMLAVEGWQGHRRVAALTLLDGQSHRAATVGWAGFYSPLTPGDGLHFSPDTELTAQDAVEYYRRGGNAHTLDWGQDQHLARGWVQPRVPAHFMLRKSEVRRERVTLARGPDGGLSVVNGLGADVRRFWYADEQGQIHTAEGVRAGARAALAATDTKVQADGANGPARAYQADWLVTLGNVVKYPERHLVPGSYLAELEAAPFVEEGLAGARAERCWSLVLGTLKGAGDES